MRLKLLAALFAVLAMVGIQTVATASTGSAEAGLWSDTYTPPATDCSTFARDGNQFCYADDPGSVELGVKFQSSAPVLITGVRVYRVDDAEVSGSLWTAAGVRLATGTFAPYAGSHGWQDLVFSTPVQLVPGTTYVASYFSPNATYAFEYDYFTDSAHSLGPITALRSTVGDGNGVFCYDSLSCFPGNTYRDLNYWVTPLWLSYDFDGFYQPVDNDKMNVVKAGRAIPVKFSLAGDKGLDILRAGYPKAKQIDCSGSGSLAAVDETVSAAGGSSLSYDASSDQYVYVWKTQKGWTGNCYRFELGLKDGSSHSFTVMAR